ncbi:MAG: hypothetical protein WD960_09125 [Gemmatimonadota bacterium]
MLVLTYLAAFAFGIGSPLCTMDFFPLSKHPELTYFWGTFGTEMLAASPGDRSLPFERREWAMPYSLDGLVGQEFALEAVAGRDSEILRALDGFDGEEGPRRVVLVLWDYDPGCAPIPFKDGERLGIPGESVFAKGLLRERDLWSQGLPTFDLFFGGQHVYPFAATKHGRESAESLQRSRAERGDTLPPPPHLAASEAFELVHSLPERCEYATYPGITSARLDQLTETWAAKRDHAGVDRLLATHQRWRLDPGENCAR